MGPILRVEFVVALEVEVPLLFADLEKPPGLRSEAPNLRLEVAEGCAGAAVAGELVVGIADETGMEIRRKELRCRPVQVGIHPVAVVVS